MDKNVCSSDREMSIIESLGRDSKDRIVMNTYKKDVYKKSSVYSIVSLMKCLLIRFSKKFCDFIVCCLILYAEYDAIEERGAGGEYGLWL